MPKTKTKADKQSVCNLIQPMRVEQVQLLANKLVAGEKITVADINGGRFSLHEVNQMWGTWDEKTETWTNGSMNHALSEGIRPVPAVPAVHQPVLLRAAQEAGMTFAFVGQAKRADKEPNNWLSSLPTWKPGYAIGDQGGRQQAPKDIRKNADPDFLVTIGDSEFVIGSEKSNAIFNLNGSKGMNTYGINCQVAKRLSFAGRGEDIANIVFRINNGVETTRWIGDRTTGSEVVFLPNQLATAGYLYRGGERLTYEQIAAAIKDEDTKGIVFRELEAPIIGNNVSRAKLLSSVKRAMDSNATREAEGKPTMWELWLKKYKGNEDAALDAIWYNATVQCRTAVTVNYCFGLRNSVTHMPMALVYGESRDDKHIAVIVGARCGDVLTANSREQLAIEAVEDVSETEVDETPKPKKSKAPKAPKAEKTEKAPKEKKPRKPRKPKAEVVSSDEHPVPTDISDTSEDVVEVAEEVEQVEQVGEVQPDDAVAVE